MQLTLRPYVTAGVAIVGASVIAATPITPPPAEFQALQSSTAAVELTAAVDPITPWVNVFTTAFANVGELGQTLAANPAPILQQVGANWLGYGETFATALQGAGEAFSSWQAELPSRFQQLSDGLASGDVSAITQTIKFMTTGLVSFMGMPMLPVLGIPADFTQNVANAASVIFRGSMGAIGSLGLGLLLTVNVTLDTVAVSGQAVVDAVNAGDAAAALNALINMPAAITDTFLNGKVQTLPGGVTRRVGGIFQQPGPIPGSRFVQGPGLLTKLLVDVRQMIADAIAPDEAANILSGLLGLTAAESAPESSEAELSQANKPPAALAASSAVAARTVTLTTDPKATRVGETVAGSDATEGTPGTPETPPAAPVDEGETDETDGETEESDDTTESEESEESNGSESPDGSTDLSNGNKSEPGETGAGSDEDTSTSDGESDSSATGTTGDDSEAGGTSTDSGAGSNGESSTDGGSPGGSDGDSDS